MSQQKTHDLHDFMRHISIEMSEEYNRIQKRVGEDPGTAGDQGEENWAELLRGWLPRTYEVVTKGRIISSDGVTSPQIDVLVLNSEYPKKLLNKKLYLAAGVAAAFECKTTLKAAHIVKAMENCTKIKNLYPARLGTPYRELHPPIIYGLLAHSHSWKGKYSKPKENIEQSLYTGENKYVSHPRYQLDLLCVADFAAWTTLKITFVGPRQTEIWQKIGSAFPKEGGASSTYLAHLVTEEQAEHFTPIGVLISHLTQRLAWEAPSLRALADYYRVVNIGGYGQGIQRTWPSSIYSNNVRSRAESSLLINRPWDEWRISFP